MRTAPGHLLVVDDDRMTRMLLTRSVTQAGHTVDAVENGQAALELLRAKPFDVVLLDVEMPDMDGFQVLEQIMADRVLRHIPVVMVSGFDQMAGVVTCIQMGAADFIHKPFDAGLLSARIENCLEKKRLIEEEISLRQQLEEKYAQLQESERLRDSLTDMIVHDLRTPLTSLLSGLYSLNLLDDLSNEQRAIWQLSVGGGESLLAMINDLLDISKMEAGGSLTLELADVEVSRVIETVVNQVVQLAQERDLTLEKEIDPDLPLLHADEEKLRRMLVNLAGNAIKFTPAGGTIRIVARRFPQEEAVRFSLADTGEGIPREAFETIFEKFGQVESRKAGRKMSTGLGLTFCKMVADVHGGRIWVESELGQGTTFSFTIPLRPADRNDEANPA